MLPYNREMGADGSYLTGNEWSTLVGGNGSTLVGGVHSTLMGGQGTTLIGGHGSIMSGGARSVLTWKYHDGARVRIHTVYVGEEGIEADTAYRGRWDFIQGEFQIECVSLSKIPSP
jgi:hypothetical protein